MISNLTLDISTFDTNLKKVYEKMRQAYTYSPDAKLAKGDFYKFLSLAGISDKLHKDTMNKIFKPESMNARSILGLKPIVVEEEPVEAEEQDEAEPNDAEEEAEEEEEEELPRFSLSRRIKSRRIRGASLPQAFYLTKYCIRMLMDYKQEDIDEMTVADIKTLIEVLRIVYTSLYRVARKYIPGFEFEL